MTALVTGKRGRSLVRTGLGALGVVSLVAGIVLLVLLFFGVSGPNRGFLMDHVRARDTMALLAPHLARYRDLCGSGEMEQPFDSSSVSRLREWCEAAVAVADSGDSDHAVALLKVQKGHFEFVTSVLVVADGPLAQTGVELLERNCVVGPKLEAMASITASAGFGQFVLSLLLFGLTAILGWAYWKGR